MTTTTTRIKVTDEATRRVIGLVLWRHTSYAIGEEFPDKVWVWPQDSDERYSEARNEASSRVG